MDNETQSLAHSRNCIDIIRDSLDISFSYNVHNKMNCSYAPAALLCKLI